MAAGRQLLAERDRRKGVPGVAEGGEQDAARRTAAQSISASSRTMRLRSCAAAVTVDTISVPTPASR